MPGEERLFPVPIFPLKEMFIKKQIPHFFQLMYKKTGVI